MSNGRIILDKRFLGSSIKTMKILFPILLLTILLLSQSAWAGTAIIRLAWDPNQESDIAGYRIYFGTSPRTGDDPAVCGMCGYTMIDVGNVTTYRIAGLTQEQTYFISATAYDTSNNQSVFSTEVSGKAKEVYVNFDGDGMSDVLWQQTTSGTVAIWSMNGTTVGSGSGGVAVVPSAWQIKGVGDFNGDGKADILWQHTDGTLAIWFMNGTTVGSGSGGFAVVPSAWQIKGVGDFNGDGKADILWQHTNGTLAIWLMNGTTVGPGSGGFAVVPSAWQIKRAGDFDGDHKADILWQNTDGTLAIWFMNGTTVGSGSGGFAVVPSTWQIKP